MLERVFEDGAFAAAALDSELARHRALEPRERGLATELVYGVLRVHGALSARLGRFAPRRIKDTKTRIQLLLAAYQVLFLTRVPAFAAVDAAVESVRAERGVKMAGFANAVLRKLVAAGESLPLEQALVEGTPSWLLERLRRAVGPDDAISLLGGGLDPQATTVSVRLVSGRPLPEWLEGSSPGRLSPRSRRFRRSGDLRALPGHREGCFVVQEEGSQAIALLLGARPGEKILDACAGRGQKTSLFVEQVGSQGRVWATDVHPPKLDALSGELARLGLPPAQVAAVDWTVGVGEVPNDFDRVLVDAPCTGTGTLWHRPEILLRLRPEDPARLAELATAILRSAATRVRPSGRVVFAVCSVLPEEGEEVVGRVLDLLEPCAFDAPELRGVLPEQASSVYFLPGTHGTDGYFAASFRRRGA